MPASGEKSLGSFQPKNLSTIALISTSLSFLRSENGAELKPNLSRFVTCTLCVLRGFVVVISAFKFTFIRQQKQRETDDVIAPLRVHGFTGCRLNVRRIDFGAITTRRRPASSLTTCSGAEIWRYRGAGTFNARRRNQSSRVLVSACVRSPIFMR